MIGRFKPRSEFARNVVTLMTGTTVAQAIPVAISPILTRLYGPEDFGALALFIAITAIFGAIANARYELAIMLPSEDEDALNIAALGLLISSALSVILLFVAISFNSRICTLLGNDHIGPWLYLAPLTVFFTGLFNVLNYYNNRIKRYKDIAQASMVKAVVLATVQLAAGVLRAGAGGLVAGQVASSLFANAKLLRNTLGRADWRRVITLERMRQQGRRYRDFPLFSMPAILANTLAQHLTNILISAYFNVATLGQYALVQRVLGMPSSLVGTAISQVFFQQATVERQRTGKAVNAFDGTVKKLALLSAPSFLLLMLVAQELFALVFGERWRIAGHYAQVLAPFFAIRFIVAAVTTINSVFEKQKISLAWQLLLLASALGSIIASHSFGLGFSGFVVVFSVVGTACYLILLFLLFMVSRGRF